MTIDLSPWPEALAKHYRAQGYWLDEPLTRPLRAQAEARPDATAIICGNRRFSYAEVDRRSSTLAARLSEQGLGPGDTALVQLPNVAEQYLVFFALLKAGVAPVNALYSHRRLELTAYAAQIQPALVIGCRGHELFRDDSFLAALSGMSRPRAVLFRGEDAPDRSLAHWLETPLRRSLAHGPTAAGAVAFFNLSGGSTGTPKLIPRTHNDYDYSVRASAEICRLTPETRYLCALPAAHNFPMSSPGALGVFHAGGTVVMAPDPAPDTCFDLIERHGVTMTGLVPSAVALWLQAAESGDARLDSLRLVQVGGASFAEAQARQVPERLGCALQQVFGMAEGLVNYTRLDDPDDVVFTTQGRPISPDDEVRVVNREGEEVPDGATGMLATRGPYTFRGYFRSPEQNAKAFDREGFYYSGDLVRRTSCGNLRVVGRVKDQINRGGEKIAAEEIENLLLRHTDVSQAALVAMPDEHLGEKSCAFVVARRGDLRAPELRRHLLGEGIAGYKLPDRIRFVETIPLTPVGKPDKNRLRETFAGASPMPA